MINVLNKILMKLGLKEKDLTTYLECADNIKKVVTDSEYTITVIEDIVGWYDIIGWKNCKCKHLSFRIWPMTTEKATFAKIDKCVNAILDTMKMHND